MLLDKLVAKQSELGENNKEFAARLDIPRETWVALLFGRLELDGRVALKIARRTYQIFPELRPDAVSFLLGDGNYVPDSGSSTNTSRNVHAATPTPAAVA